MAPTKICEIFTHTHTSKKNATRDSKHRPELGGTETYVLAYSTSCIGRPRSVCTYTYTNKSLGSEQLF